MGGGFFFGGGGDKDESSIKNMENYDLEVSTKTVGLYQVSKLRNLIFFRFFLRGLVIYKLGFNGPPS